MKVIMVETNNGWEYVAALTVAGFPLLLTTEWWGNAISGNRLTAVKRMFPERRFKLKEISE